MNSPSIITTDGLPQYTDGSSQEQFPLWNNSLWRYAYDNNYLGDYLRSSTSTGWWSSQYYNYIIIDCGTATSCNRWTITYSQSAGRGARLFGSNDGQSYFPITPQQYGSSESTVNVDVTFSQVTYRYYLIPVVDGGGSPGTFIWNFHLYNSLGEITSIIPNTPHNGPSLFYFDSYKYLQAIYSYYPQRIPYNKSSYSLDGYNLYDNTLGDTSTGYTLLYDAVTGYPLNNSNYGASILIDTITTGATLKSLKITFNSSTANISFNVYTSTDGSTWTTPSNLIVPRASTSGTSAVITFDRTWSRYIQIEAIPIIVGGGPGIPPGWSAGNIYISDIRLYDAIGDQYLPHIPIINFYADNYLVLQGELFNLEWTSQYAHFLYIDQGIGNVNVPDGDLGTSIQNTTTFTITAINASSSASASVTINVSIPPPNPCNSITCINMAAVPVSGSGIIDIENITDNKLNTYATFGTPDAGHVRYVRYDFSNPINIGKISINVDGIGADNLAIAFLSALDDNDDFLGPQALIYIPSWTSVPNEYLLELEFPEYARGVVILPDYLINFTNPNASVNLDVNIYDIQICIEGISEMLQTGPNPTSIPARVQCNGLTIYQWTAGSSYPFSNGNTLQGIQTLDFDIKSTLAKITGGETVWEIGAYETERAATGKFSVMLHDYRALFLTLGGNLVVDPANGSSPETQYFNTGAIGDRLPYFTLVALSTNGDPTENQIYPYCKITTASRNLDRTKPTTLDVSFDVMRDRTYKLQDGTVGGAVEYIYQNVIGTPVLHS